MRAISKLIFVILILVNFFTLCRRNTAFDTVSIEDAREIVKRHSVKLLALYFPQFHPIPENDLFWGKDFTEWTLLNKYKGPIKKPHEDIGYYNMLDREVRKKQGEIAKKHGIYGFCYYHYWFKNRKVMYKGLEKVIEEGEPNLPFILCWANEPWTRAWDGSTKQVLLDQNYGDEQDWKNHFDYLLSYFHHPLYIKEDGCPLFYIYRLEHIIKKNALEMLIYMRERAKQAGFNGLKIIAILGGFHCPDISLDTIIDGYAEHQPTFGSFKYNQFIVGRKKKCLSLDANAYIESLLGDHKKIGTNYTQGIFFSWDNSSRRINRPAIQFSPITYTFFEYYIAKVLTNIDSEPNKDNNFILLNSWNEWTEQAMVEPNAIDGYSILESLQKFFGE